MRTYNGLVNDFKINRIIQQAGNRMRRGWEKGEKGNKGEAGGN